MKAKKYLTKDNFRLEVKKVNGEVVWVKVLIQANVTFFNFFTIVRRWNYIVDHDDKNYADHLKFDSIQQAVRYIESRINSRNRSINDEVTIEVIQLPK